MVDPKEIDTLNSELESRLDDLFGENDVPLPDGQEQNQKEYYPLAELKNLILSIDWEITDEVLNKLIQQLKDLQLTYKHDKIVMTFLQILNSLGTYIQTHRAKAHPKTFKILNSVFSNLDKIVLKRDMPDSTKKKILRAEMNRYKDLRNQIAKSKKAAAQRKAKIKPVKTEAAETRQQKEEPVLKLDEPVAEPAIAEKENEPVFKLDEPVAEPAIAEKDNEPVLKLDEPVAEPAIAEKDHEPVIRLDQPTEAAAIQKGQEEPVLTLADFSEPAAEDRVEEALISSPEPEPEPPTALSTLAEAVEEIKRFIHIEINALKEEIQSLKAQQ